jgi:hypothetical protein
MASDSTNSLRFRLGYRRLLKARAIALTLSTARVLS